MASQPVDFLSGLGGIGALPHPYDDQQQVGQDQQRWQLGAQAIQQNQQVLAQQQAAQQHQQQFHSDVMALGDNPTPAATAGLIRKYPEFAKQLSDAHNIQDEAKRNADFKLQSQIYAAAQNGRYDLASSLLKSHRDASVKAGEPADPSDEAIITALDSGDPAEQKRALSMIGLSVASINPDKFSETYKTLNPSAAPNSKVVGDYLLDDTGKVLFHANKTEYKTVKNADGSESLVEVGGGSTGGGGPASSGGASSGGDGAPLSTRLNNPGAIKFDPANKWQGQVGQQGGFVQFDTPANGQRAQQKLIANQIRGGFDTPLAWAQHYAPASDGNDPTAYAQTVAKGLGIGINDKIPMSAVPKMAALSAGVEAGGTPSPASGQAPGGPKVLYTSKGASSADLMSPDELNFYAEKVAGGADLPPLGMGKDAAVLRRQILAKAADIALNQGITGGQSNLLHSQLRANTSSLTALGKLQTFVNSAEDTASANADQVLHLAPKGVAGGIPLFNSWVQAGRKATGNPDISRFNLALDTLANEYAKVMTTNTGSGGVTSEAAANRAHDLINHSQTLDQLKGVISQMRIDMGNRKTALARQNDILSGNISNAAGRVNAPPAAPAAPQAQSGPVQVKTRAEALALPPGTPFLDPQGHHRVRP